MTASELIDKLAGSGTGTGKLAAYRTALTGNPKATAAELVAACEPHVPAGTTAKARAFVESEPAAAPRPPAEPESSEPTVTHATPPRRTQRRN